MKYIKLFEDFNENDSDEDKIFSIAKSGDFDLAEQLAISIGKTLPEILEDKFLYLLDKEINSKEIECGHYNFNFKIKTLDFEKDEIDIVCEIDYETSYVDIYGQYYQYNKQTLQYEEIEKVRFNLNDAMNDEDFGCEVEDEVYDIVDEIMEKFFGFIHFNIFIKDINGEIIQNFRHRK